MTKQEEEAAIRQAILDMKFQLDLLEQRMNNLFTNYRKPCGCKQCEQRRLDNARY